VNPEDLQESDRQPQVHGQEDALHLPGSDL
jgi:hypothetical protein